MFWILNYFKILEHSQGNGEPSKFIVSNLIILVLLSLNKIKSVDFLDFETISPFSNVFSYELSNGRQVFENLK